MPKLLFCAPTAYVGGGVEEWLWTLSQALEEHGWQVEIGLVEGQRFHRPARYLERYPYENPHIISAPSGLREERFCRLLHVFRKVKPDILIPVQLADVLYAGARWKRTTEGANMRMVTCSHGLFPKVLDDWQRCCGDIDACMSVSKAGYSRLLEQRHWPESQVFHVPTGVPIPTTPQKRCGAILRVGYVGRLDQAEKRVLDLVDLVKATRAKGELEFHVAGAGPESARVHDALAEDIRSGRVVWHGLLSRQELQESLYPVLDVLVLFSPAEGGPIVAWEAMAHGIVPVVSDFAGRIEEGVLVEGQNCLVFPVGDVERAAHHIQTLLSDAEWNCLSEAARQLPAAYHAATFASRWDQVLRAVLEYPVRTGTNPLPKLVSSGRLSRRLDERTSFWIRRLVRNTRAPVGPGDEWPHAYGGLD